MKHNIKTEEFEEIKNLYNKGNSLRKIAKLYSVTHATISKIIKEFGIEIRKNEKNSKEKGYAQNYYKNNKEKYKQYHLNRNKEQLKIYQKHYKENNKDKLKKYQKDRYLENKEKILQNSKNWSENNKDRKKETNKKYREDINNKEKIYKKQSEWVKKNPKKRKSNELKSKYGITLEQYEEMLINQNGCCKACKKHKSEFTRILCVDHCHETGIIRGLLCHRCNSALGMVKDKIETLKSLIDYLKDFNKIIK